MLSNFAIINASPSSAVNDGMYRFAALQPLKLNGCSR
jgi:hypothetical protein